MSGTIARSGQAGGIQQGVDTLQTTIGYTPPLRGQLSVSQFGAKGDGVTDDTAAMQLAVTAAVEQNKLLVIPETASFYRLTNYLDLPSNLRIQGDGLPTLKATNPSQPRVFRMNAVSAVDIRGLRLDGAKADKVSGHITTINLCDDIILEGLVVVDPRASINITTSTNVRVSNCSITNGGGDGVRLDDSSNCEVINLRIQDCSGFGVFLLNGAHHNLVQGCITQSSYLELIGIRFDCHHNRILGNHAEGTGDNGISVTGYYNVIAGNICTNNYHTGIWLYGRNNTCVGNICKNNGQRFLVDDTDWSGIQLESYWGGYSHGNSVVGNTCLDDQATKTQLASIWVRNNYMGTWGEAKVVGNTGVTYWTNGQNIYFCESPSGTVTGATPPTHTSGTVSDGGALWTYCATFPGSASARLNYIAGNSCGAGRGSSEISVEPLNVNTISQANVAEMNGWRLLAGDWVAAGGARKHRRTAVAWATGQAVVYGDVRGSGNLIYRCINAGGTTSGTAPSHTSGTVTGADGVAWLYLYTDLSASQALTQHDTDGFRVMHRFIIQAIDGDTVAYDMAGTGTPEAKVAAPVGSIYRRTDGGAGTAFYVKETGTGNTGWNAIVTTALGDNLTATGSTQGTALALASRDHIVTTTPAGTGVVLNNTIRGVQTVFNAGANALLVYPTTGGTIHGNAVDAAVSVAAGAAAQFLVASATRFYQL